MRSFVIRFLVNERRSFISEVESTFKMSNENVAKYLRLLEDEREAQTVCQVRPSPFTPTQLIQSLIQEKSTTNRKEVWALEIGPKNRAFTTAQERDGDSRGRNNNGFLDSLGEPKVEVAKAAGVVLLTETFSLKAADPQGLRRKVHLKLLTPPPIHVLTIRVPSSKSPRHGRFHGSLYLFQCAE